MTSEGIQPESFRPEESLANQDCIQFSMTSLYKKSHVVYLYFN